MIRSQQQVQQTDSQNGRSSIVKNFCVSAVGLGFARALTALSLLVILVWISPADYGIWGLMTSFISLLTLCTSMGLRQFFATEYFHIDTNTQKQLVTRILTLYSCSTLLSALVLSINFSFINAHLFFNKLTWPVFILMLICAYLSLCNDLFMQQVKYSSKAHVFTVLTLIQSSITASITLLFVYVFNAGITGLLLGFCAGLLSIFVYALYNYYRAAYYTYCALPNLEYSTYIKKSCIFMPGLIAGWIISSYARWLLSAHTSLYYVGIYSFAARCSYIIELIIIQALNCSYIPATLSRFSTSTHTQQQTYIIEQANKKIMLMCILSMLIIIGLLALGARPVLAHILPACYCEHLGCLWLMLIGSVFLIGSYFTFIYIQFHRHTKALAYISFVPALLSILCNSLLIPRFGIYGCAGVYALVYALYFGISLVYNYWLTKISQN